MGSFCDSIRVCDGNKLPKDLHVAVSHVTVQGVILLISENNACKPQLRLSFAHNAFTGTGVTPHVLVCMYRHVSRYIWDAILCRYIYISGEPVWPSGKVLGW